MPVDKHKKELAEGTVVIPKASLPAISIVDALIYEVDFTNSAKKRAEEEGRSPKLFDGIAVKMVYLNAFVGKKLDEKKVLIDISNPEAITFPCDIEGPVEKQYCGITTNLYITGKMLTNKFNGNYNVTDITPDEIIISAYDTQIGKHFGDKFTGSLIDIIMQLNFINNLTDVKPERLTELLGYTPRTEEQYPVVKCFRYAGFKEKKDVFDDKGKPVREFYQELSNYDKETKSVVNFDINWLSANVTNKIITAMQDRDIQKNALKEKFNFGKNSPIDRKDVF